MKEYATILDATAGNRMIWQNKDSPYILFIDIEPNLEFPPDRVLDCTNTDLPDESFNVVFFDPPHAYSNRNSLQRWHSCRNKEELKEFNEKYGLKYDGLAYYGEDKLHNKQELLIFIHKSQKEFLRILKPDGMLWFKWSEMKIPLSTIMPFFKGWILKLKFHIASPHQTAGKSKAFWLMFMKSAEFTNKEGS